MSVSKINLKEIKNSDINFSKIYTNSDDAKASLNSITVKNTEAWGDNNAKLYYNEQTGLVSEQQSNGEMVGLGYINKDSFNNVETVDLTAGLNNAKEKDMIEEKNRDAREIYESGKNNQNETKERVMGSTGSVEENETIPSISEYDGPVLTRSAGRINGPSGEETYYNLKMDGVVRIMRDMGFSEEEYPYHVREDGVKMLGDYVMVAANLNLRPRGSFVDSSLGKAIVCDTGGFAEANPTQLDIAVDW